MSMLSAQCERLRNIAYNLSMNGYAEYPCELRNAADTIDNLRFTCNDLQRESERLRETMAQMTHDHAEQGREINKLKSLVRALWDVALHPQLFGDGSHLLERMHELGVEVDDDPPMSDAARRVFDRLMDELGGDSDER